MSRAQLIIRTLLIAFILTHFPWRLCVLGARAMQVSPGAVHLVSGNDAQAATYDLEARLTALGWAITYAPAGMTGAGGEQAYGLTDWQTHMITVDASLSWNQKYQVLAHEAGHVFAPGWFTQGEHEVFAEAVAYLITQGCCNGLSNLKEHARYMARFKSSVPFVLFVEWKRAYRAAAFLTE